MKLHKQPSPGIVNICGALLCLFLLLASYYFEYIRGMAPCLLCLLQRWSIGILVVIFFIGAMHHPKGASRYIYNCLGILAAVVGAIASGRQVWLQHQPPGSITTCVPSLSFLLQTRPFHEVIKTMFHGGQDCAAVLWQWAGLTMAEWMLLIFIGIIIFLLVVMGLWIKK